MKMVAHGAPVTDGLDEFRFKVKISKDTKNLEDTLIKAPTMNECEEARGLRS